MKTLDDLITYGTDSRQTKRASSVKMVQNGMAPLALRGIYDKVNLPQPTDNTLHRIAE